VSTHGRPTHRQRAGTNLGPPPSNDAGNGSLSPGNLERTDNPAGSPTSPLRNTLLLHLAYYSIASSNLIDVLLQDRKGSAVTTTRVTTRSFPGVPNLPQFDPIVADAYMGDYIANVSAGGHEYLAWGDNRDKVRNFLWPAGRNDPDVFFARR
jgi:hypothetical protein